MSFGTDDANIRWEDGTPVSARYEDPYFSREDGLAETRHVFLDGNDLSRRLSAGGRFAIAELGFGTGLNFFAALDLWRRVAPGGGHLDYTSFERFPLEPEQIEQALAPWPELRALAAPVLVAMPAQAFDLGDCTLRIVLGDARETLPAWQGPADAWFLDGFAPARNPEMWQRALLTAVHDRTAPGGTFATYTAAGHVRRALRSAGFEVRKAPGFGRKRDMLTGQRPEGRIDGNDPHTE